VLLAVAVGVSIVHYVDNFAAFDRFPQRDGAPQVTKAMVAVAWPIFTAFGVAGLVAFRRRAIPAAAVCLAAYSGSGLVGIGHYTAPGMTDAVWWRQAHVILDILCGAAVLAFALWSVRHRSELERGAQER
jgi:hypothetical protein